jgi:putative membrane protein
LLLALAAAAVAISGIGPNDRLTWYLEVAPVLIAAPILIVAYHRFPLSDLTYTLLFLHAVVLVVGAHYTYAEVPLGFWAQDLFDFSRNHYDRIGHFAQGFVPAIVARELLKRWSPLGESRWMPFVIICICLAGSAFYELIEWWGALILGQAATQFLGTQGDVWDTQWDMFLALTGATAALAMLSRPHDRSLVKLANRLSATGAAPNR